jgi:O-antigen ligase
MNLINTKAGFLGMIVLHIVLGLMLKFLPILVAAFFALAFMLMFIDVIYTLDKDNRAGFYALYLIGFEMAYRMAGAPFSWELGKYFSILMLLIGLIISKRKFVPWPFVLMLILLIPAIFLAQHKVPHLLRTMIMFNISGPLTLVFAGLYFYKRPIFESDYFQQLRFAILPAFTIVAGLTFMASLAGMEFTSVQSNADATAGFGPNQVSTSLGWFILLIMLFKINGRIITPFAWMDWLLLFYVVLRALITFSRGGVMGSSLALIGAIVVLFLSYESFRVKVKKAFPFVILGLAFFIGVFIYANSFTNNYLLYRYQGKDTTEVLSGKKQKGSSLLTGRDKLLLADFYTFLDHPGLGVGVGMGASYRARYYGHAAASHTEFTRFLSEHGILGLVFMLVGMIIVPIAFFKKAKDPVTRCFFIAFYLLSMFTMFHAAMRLAMPGVVFGAALMRIVPKPVASIQSETEPNGLGFQ